MWKGILCSFLWIFVLADQLMADESSLLQLNSGDTAWVLISSALVMLMTVPGLALFYGGLTRNRVVLNTIFMSLISYAIVSILWIIYGYSLAFKGDWAGVIGSFSMSFLKGFTLKTLNNTLPEALFIIFQLTFAGITCALISGAFIERIRFSAWILFTLTWFTLVYVPVSHWVWGGGFLMKIGALDFAGGTVVHINAGIAALVGALFLGKRRDPVLKPHNLTLVALGTGLLWFGWFGFNGGSTLSANALAATAFLNTNTAAATAALSWMFTEWLYVKKPTVLGFCSGAVTGLVAITPAAGFVSPVSSLFIGGLSGILSYLAVAKMKPTFEYDDALDVFGIHGIAGIFGAILTGILADPAINPSGKGLLFGKTNQLWIQILSVTVVIVYNFLISTLIFFFLKLIGILKVIEEDEKVGLDLSQHGEKAYELE